MWGYCCSLNLVLVLAVGGSASRMWLSLVFWLTGLVGFTGFWVAIGLSLSCWLSLVLRFVLVCLLSSGGSLFVLLFCGYFACGCCVD